MLSCYFTRSRQLVFAENITTDGHVSVGLLALVDDLTVLAKLVASSVDDAAAQAAKAGGKAITKASGIVIDDAAVTPRYVTGFAADRELPIIGKIALGSLKNKLIFLLPGALLLSWLAPWAITPLLMAGGLYLCYEGAEKIVEIVSPHGEDAIDHGGGDPRMLETAKVQGAIKTDIVLSAEIIAISLAAVADLPLLTRAIVLVGIGVGMTVVVYGAVALIVKADDAGLALARSRGGPLVRGFGRGLVGMMPGLLQLLGYIGTAAMLWVGGGIIIHGLEHYGIDEPGHTIAALGDGAAAALPAVAAALDWLVGAIGAGLLGLALGGGVLGLLHLRPARLRG